MKLLVISHTPHYKKQNKIVGWGPTMRELDHLSSLFSSVVHLAPLHPDSAPQSSLPYLSNKITFRPVKPSGGSTLAAKIGILFEIPKYIFTIILEAKKADVIHIRCPSNISLLAILLLPFIKITPYRWIKYAGNWKPSDKDAFSYRFQRWWLSLPMHKGTVTVNGNWPDQPQHIFGFLNPSLTMKEIQDGLRANKEILAGNPIQILYVGRVESAKGVGKIIEISRILQRKGINFKCHIVGDGEELNDFLEVATKKFVSNNMVFHGWKTRDEVAEFYKKAHFILFPSTSSEGWPKVLSEGMAYGAVPIASAISSIPQILSRENAGISLPPENLDEFSDSIIRLSNYPSKWKEYSVSGIQAARKFTYEYYLDAVQSMFLEYWGVPLGQQSSD
jgi:glycosyltransferase involved in cell wall biosynthesis